MYEEQNVHITSLCNCQWKHSLLWYTTELICKLQLRYMHSSYATSHKVHITVMRFKTKLELSKKY